jgi:hypothetical protein
MVAMPPLVSDRRLRSDHGDFDPLPVGARRTEKQVGSVSSPRPLGMSVAASREP